MPPIRQHAEPASSSGGAGRPNDRQRTAGDPFQPERPTAHAGRGRPTVDPGHVGSSPASRAGFLADSGRPGDEVRPVSLRGVGGTVWRGAIRGPLPATLSVLGEEYELSRFSQVDAEGAAVITYRASTGARSTYR